MRPLPALSTLLRRTMTTCPVPGDWPSPSLDSVPRSALRPALDHGAKMPRIRFYNRRFAPRAPMTNITFGDCPSSNCGKPASVRFRDRLLDCGRSWRSRFPRATPDHLAVIRTSNSSAFDDALPASGRSAATFQRFWRQVGEKLRRFVGMRELRRIEPSDTSRRRLCLAFGAKGALARPVAPLSKLVRCRAPEAKSREPVPAGARQCADIPELEGAFHRRGSERASFSNACPANALSSACFANALSSACEECLPSAGQRWQSPHVFIEVRKPRLDPCPLAVRERLQGRVLHFGFCRWMFPRARLGPLEHPVPRRVVGTTAMLDAKSRLKV